MTVDVGKRSGASRQTIRGPSERAVLDLLRTEVALKLDQAQAILEVFRRMAFSLKVQSLQRREYDDARASIQFILRYGTQPRAGSAHDLLNRHLLGPPEIFVLVSDDGKKTGRLGQSVHILKP